MPKRQVFYSFHYDNDVFRVQQIRNIGAFEQNEPVSPNQWEQVKKGGEPAIKKWIDDTMSTRSCVAVLVGMETASRQWVKYEIEKAWSDKKGLFGIYIHNLKCPKKGVCQKGINPFDQYKLGDKDFSSIVKCYQPNVLDAYNDIKKNIDKWVEEAISIRQKY